MRQPFFYHFHSQYENSANNWISKNILHRIFYRFIVRKSYKYFQKIYFIDEGNMFFLKELYGINKSDWNFEFLPLGGFIIEEDEKRKIRNRVRKKYGIDDNKIMLLHSGKLSKEKRTADLLLAFSQVDNIDLELYIVGKIARDQSDILNKLINNDSRIKFLGWKSSTELRELLCACDIYVQPGSPSSTFETALCVGCPTIVNMREEVGGGGYSTYIDKSMVCPIRTIEDIANAINKLTDKEKRASLSKYSLEYAKKELDYIVQVKKIIKDDRSIN